MKSLLIISMLLCSLSVFAKKEPALKYDIECSCSGHSGTSLVKVSVYISKPDQAVEMLKKASVHGVIFRCYNDNQWGKQSPIAKSASSENEYAGFYIIESASFTRIDPPAPML